MITARAAATFEPVGRSVAVARAFVRDTLHGWGFADVVDDAVVLTSELVTNAVIHAGTAADVTCLRYDTAVRVEVADHYPEREVPLQSRGRQFRDSDNEGGRGLMLCAALANRWGVEYTPAGKDVWFQLDLPERPAGTRSAGPVLPTAELPVADERVRVAVVQVDADGVITRWNDDAADLFGHAAADIVGKSLADVTAWPQTPGTGIGLAEALRLSRWEGTYGLRDADGRVLPVYGSHLRVRDSAGAPSTVCLLVRAEERAVLQTPSRGPAGSDGGASRQGKSADAFEVFIGSPAPDDLDGLLQRTVERARDMLDGDAAYLLLATDDETELEVRASTGLPSARQRFARVPVEAGTGRYGSARMPAVHEDLTAAPGAVPLLSGTGMRSVVTVPLKVEGRLTGSLGVAAEAPGRYSNQEALRLQFAADRIALAVESARLTELERLRRGSLSFLVEASDLLAGTLERDQTLALMAQMTVPTLASWCAVYTMAEQAEPELAFVLHEDEDRIDGIKALLSQVRPPDPDPTPGARIWTAPSDAAHSSALRASLRSLGVGNGPSGARPASTPGIVLATAAAVGGETVVLPLVARNRVIGMLTLGKPTDERFRQEILELAEDLSRRAALALDNARLYSERTAISQALQRSLLPPELPSVPGVEVEVVYRAAGEGNEVGGDFYDLFPIRDGCWGFAIGDVCGTGPEAAAVTGLARHALRLLAREGFGGPAVLERLNAAILDEGARSRFLTLLYGELWPQQDGSAVLRMVCAGHPLPLRLRPDGTVEPAADPQPLLGVMEDLELVEQSITLDPGDVMLCVTDGVTERREGSRMLGDDGLADVLATCTGLTAGAVAARIQRAVERFASDAPSDDMAILAMRVPELPKD
ncbi:SpoIIE family protein phosphatase [Actinacidiphila sp. DG2A-62]|uniref:SpoIIE family protein phosphatase n=1 Tax=Actinacidiphila sp. DG2A-62 TaxID=3108821 RepID=UPI002DB8F637|nr:SpoIIE family protein phosphatase [Actinacidiphila sp. DG2A-62]MEC3997531.1 SpoIIE family protein phosphatase [Actinacidiphila sp. DG2A-62]